MSAGKIDATTSVKLILGPFEITCTNLNKDQLTNALKDFLSTVKSFNEEVSTISFKFAGSASRVASVINVVPTDSNRSTLSITEFIRKTQRRKGTEIALAIAYYLFKERNLRIINTKDLGDAYDEARLTKLTNPADTLNKLVTGGKMMRAEDKDDLKGYTITQTGEEEVTGWLAPTG